MHPVNCYWQMRQTQGKSLVWPDGCRDLIAIMTEGQPMRLVCSGLDRHARQITCSASTYFVGIRLVPGVRFAWEKQAASWFYDRCLQPFACVTADWQIQPDAGVMQAVLMQLLEEALPVPGWIDDCFRQIGAGQRIVLGSLGERSIRRRLTELTGAPPGYWHGLARVRRTGLALLHSAAPLAEVAADQGYADQSHMQRDIRRWFGCTPQQLRHNPALSLSLLSAPDAFSPV